MTYVVEDVLQPRSLVYASNAEALVLQSVTPETRLTFINGRAHRLTLVPNFVVSASNESLRILKDSDRLVAEFTIPESTDQPTLTVPGKVVADTFAFADANPLSSNQFAGISFDPDTSNVLYHTITDSNSHVFYAGTVETLRVQTDKHGLAQVSIGGGAASLQGAGAQTALHVAGNTVVDGSLVVDGLTLDSTTVPTLHPVTHRLQPSQLPEGVALLNDSNQLDASLLPSGPAFQFLRSSKNIGIGTRVAMQKFHVEGTGIFSDRLGIGTYYPAARLHLRETAMSGPILILENSGGGTLLDTYVNGSNALHVAGTHAGVGIGTNVVPLTSALEAHGNANIHGNLQTSNLTTYGLRVEDPDTHAALLSHDTVAHTWRSYLPLEIPMGITTPSISTVGATSEVHFKNCSARIDGDIVLGGQMYQFSDARLKTDIQPLVNPLQRLERIRGYSYTMNNRPQVGLLAQELQSILPEAVTLLPEDRFAVSYDAVIPLLVEAVRNLAHEVKQLRRSR